MSKDDFIIADIAAIIVRIRYVCGILSQFVALPQNRELVEDYIKELLQGNQSSRYLEQLESDNLINMEVIGLLDALNLLVERYSQYGASLDCLSDISVNIISIAENWDKKWDNRPMSVEFNGILEALKRYQQVDGQRIWVGIDDDILLLEQIEGRLLHSNESYFEDAAKVLNKAMVKLREIKDEYS